MLPLGIIASETGKLHMLLLENYKPITYLRIFYSVAFWYSLGQNRCFASQNAPFLWYNLSCCSEKALQLLIYAPRVKDFLAPVCFPPIGGNNQKLFWPIFLRHDLIQPNFLRNFLTLLKSPSPGLYAPKFKVDQG